MIKSEIFVFKFHWKINEHNKKNYPVLRFWWNFMFRIYTKK